MVPARVSWERNRLPLIARWKIFDNLRRSLLARRLSHCSSRAGRSCRAHPRSGRPSASSRWHSPRRSARDDVRHALALRRAGGRRQRNSAWPRQAWAAGDVPRQRCARAPARHRRDARPDLVDAERLLEWRRRRPPRVGAGPAVRGLRLAHDGQSHPRRGPPHRHCRSSSSSARGGASTTGPLAARPESSS